MLQFWSIMDYTPVKYAARWTVKNPLSILRGLISEFQVGKEKASWYFVETSVFIVRKTQQRRGLRGFCHLVDGICQVANIASRDTSHAVHMGTNQDIELTRKTPSKMWNELRWHTWFVRCGSYIYGTRLSSDQLVQASFHCSRTSQSDGRQ